MKVVLSPLSPRGRGIGTQFSFGKESFMKTSKTSVILKKTRSRHTTPKKKNILSNVGLFRWVKKSFLGISRKESVDLLDQWILKKRAMSLFF